MFPLSNSSALRADQSIDAEYTRRHIHAIANRIFESVFHHCILVEESVGLISRSRGQSNDTSRIEIV